MEGINVILKYKRKEEKWICPGCETENSIGAGNCLLCGRARTPDAVILRAWSPQDEINNVPPSYNQHQGGQIPPRQQVPPVRPADTGRVFVDDVRDYTPPKKSHKFRNTVIILLVIALILGGIYMALFGWNQILYSRAVDEFNKGNYEAAIEQFEKLPSDYKDVEEKINESNYQIGMDYYNEGSYVKAMGKFHSLGSYSDSQDMLYYVEISLTHMNERGGKFKNYDFMEGKWTDDDGNFVNYTRKSDDSIEVSFNLPYDRLGDLSLGTNGIHYHADDYGDYIYKQWIYQPLDYYTVDVYNYTDGSTYTLTKN